MGEMREMRVSDAGLSDVCVLDDGRRPVEQGSGEQLQRLPVLGLSRHWQPGRLEFRRWQPAGKVFSGLRLCELSGCLRSKLSSRGTTNES